MTKCEWIMKVTTDFTRILWANWQVCTQAQAIDKREAQREGPNERHCTFLHCNYYIIIIYSNDISVCDYMCVATH